MSGLPLCGHLCFRFFLLCLPWENKVGIGWECAPCDLGPWQPHAWRSAKSPACSPLCLAQLGEVAPAWWTAIGGCECFSSHTLHCPALCPASSPRISSWLLTWTPGCACTCRDVSATPVQLLAVWPSTTHTYIRAYTHWSLWELVQTYGHSSVWLLDPWSLSLVSSLWPIVFLIAGSQTLNLLVGRSGLKFSSELNMCALTQDWDRHKGALTHSLTPAAAHTPSYTHMCTE